MTHLHKQHLQIPLDFMGWPEIRTLSLHGEMGLARATYLAVRLFADLGYGAQAGGPVGTLGRKARDLYLLEASRTSGLMPEAVTAALRAAELVVDAPGDGWECPRFAALNGHMSRDWTPMHQRGGAATRRRHELARERRAADEQALLLPEANLARPDGAPMLPEEASKVTFLIRLADNSLGQPERPTRDYGRALVLDAFAVATATPDEMVERVLGWVMEHRSHPAVPSTAEQLLAPGVWRAVLAVAAAGER